MSEPTTNLAFNLGICKSPVSFASTLKETFPYKDSLFSLVAFSTLNLLALMSKLKVGFIKLLVLISPDTTSEFFSASNMVKLDRCKPLLSTCKVSFFKLNFAFSLATLKAAFVKSKFPLYLGSDVLPVTLKSPEKLPEVSLISPNERVFNAFILKL